MNFAAQYSNLEAIPNGWTTASGPSINPVAPAAFNVEQWNGGLTTVIAGLPYSGALAKCPLPLPPGVSNFTLSYQIRPDMDAEEFSQIHETDLILVDAAGSWYNGSCQKNNAEGGMWQVVNAAGSWVDTGFKPGLFAPMQWTPVSVVYKVNWGVGISMVSITDNGTTFQIPSTLQNLPLKTGMGWAPNEIVIQVQECLNGSAGAYTRDMTAINIAMS